MRVILLCDIHIVTLCNIHIFTVSIDDGCPCIAHSLCCTSPALVGAILVVILSSALFAHPLKVTSGSTHHAWSLSYVPGCGRIACCLKLPTSSLRSSRTIVQILETALGISWDIPSLPPEGMLEGEHLGPLLLPNSTAFRHPFSQCSLQFSITQRRLCMKHSAQVLQSPMNLMHSLRVRCLHDQCQSIPYRLRL